MPKSRLNSIELFVGAGGLALGAELAGVRHDLVTDWNSDACNTLQWNQSRGHSLVQDWDIRLGDVRDIDFTKFHGGIQLVMGGPPCQPFSMGGKHKGYRDDRDMFPQAIRAVRDIRPEAFVFENVRGLTRKSFANYLEYIKLQMSYPYIVKESGEVWEDHRCRLERHHTGSCDPDRYNVVVQLLNAADFGVPQHRYRVFFVGIRADIGRMWSYPRATHSQDALLYDQWVTGSYWESHKVAQKARPNIDGRIARRVRQLKDEYSVERPKERAWRTVRDAISDLPTPGLSERDGAKYQGHIRRDGARCYPGHTGSPLDEPSKALKAGDHGVPGGENMLRNVDGSVRYYTVRESCRIQTFPDDYQVVGSWTESMRQLGNAVPVELSRAVTSSLVRELAVS